MICQYLCEKQTPLGTDRFWIVTTSAVQRGKPKTIKRIVVKDAVGFDDLGSVVNSGTDRQERRKLAAHHLRSARYSGYTITKVGL